MMKLKNLLLAGAVSAAMSFTAVSQAETFAECVATDLAVFDGSIVDAAVATPALSTLVTAVTAAGLGDALATTENITVYAPTNEAFDALGGLLDVVLADSALLTAVLTYHVTPSKQDPRKFLNATKRATLQGQSVFFHRQGGEARVNDSAITCQGVKTDNGIVWIVDSVLMPQL
jgi:uncharacterized surface protein with fasciclin (FAS1) repeats